MNFNSSNTKYATLGNWQMIISEAKGFNYNALEQAKER